MKQYKHKTQKDWTAELSATLLYYNVTSKKGSYLMPKELIENSNDWELIKPTVEVGKVYKDIASKRIFLVRELIDEVNIFAIGFCQSGNWHELTKWGLDKLEVEATKEEWLERLKIEAEKRGLVKGVKFKSAFDSSEHTLFHYRVGSFNSFIGGDKGCLMNSDNGKWATPIVEEKELPNYRQKSFEAIQRITGFTPLESDIDEIQQAINQDLNDYVKTYKKPIINTHDGVELFDGELKVHYIDRRSFTYYSTKLKYYKKHYLACEVFSTREKAQEYVNNNQKRYSLNDIRNTMSLKHPSYQCDLINQLKKIK